MPLFGPNLEKLRENGDVDGLIESLSHSRHSVRAAAAHALGELEDPRALEPLLMVLQERETKEAVRAAALEAVGRIGTIDKLISILAAGSDEARRGATSALAKLGDPRALEPVAAFFIERLRTYLDDFLSNPFLRERFRDDPGQMIDGLMSSYLGLECEAVVSFGSRAIGYLEAALDDPDELVRLGIAGALLRIGGPEVEALSLAERIRRGPPAEPGPEEGPSVTVASVTIWAEDEATARRLVTDGQFLVATLRPTVATEAAFLAAITDNVGGKISGELSRNPTRGGFDVSLVMEKEIENRELAARAAKAYERAHSTLRNSGTTASAMRSSLLEAAEIIRDELGDPTVADALSNVSILDDSQVAGLYRRHFEDTERAAAQFADLASQL